MGWGLLFFIKYNDIILVCGGIFNAKCGEWCFLRRLYLKRILKRVKQVGANVFVHESTEIYAPEFHTIFK